MPSDSDRSPLDDLRDRLDATDRGLVDLLAERQRLVRDVASVKQDDRALPLYDPARERDLLGRVQRLAEEAGLDGYFASTVFRRILDHSVRVQAAEQNGAAQGGMRVAFQGEDGCYSHAAARRHLAGQNAQFRGYRTFAHTVEALRRGEVDRAVLPVENTVAGPIEDVLDLIAERGLVLVGEEIVRVEHCLLATEPVPLGRITHVGSHAKALAQCSQFLASLPGVKVEAEDDTAGAARLVAESGDPARAAIAGADAAERYGLVVVQRHIANRKDNFTRFVVVAREDTEHDARLPHKTSLLLTTDHQHGALAQALQVLAAHGLNLTKLEARPAPEGPWRYRFFVDLEGGTHEPRVEAALAEVGEKAAGLRVLGSYPIAGAASAESDGKRPVVAQPSRAGKAASGDGAVEQAEPVAKPVVPADPGARRYPLVSRQSRAGDTVVEIGGVEIGGDRQPVLIAGPCSVESRDQIMASAKAVREAGGRMLRGGCFKPRTSPYDFQGLGFEGLHLLAEAGRAYGLPIVTEVLHPADVEAVAREADVLQIGARNMQNVELLKAVGKVRTPVLLKRGLMGAIDEWLAAAEYVLAEGNARVILCERGIRTFETATRNTLDLSAVVVARERTHLPVIVDPSHAAGVRRWVPPLAKAALAAGAHGLLIEAHPDPENACSDGPQSLTLDGLERLGDELGLRTIAA
jgi:chorismate mutase/prephenate dehydratase